MIGILSPFLSQNYGTVLQAFALAKQIQELGGSCEYIDWRYFDTSFIGRLRFLLHHPLFLYDQRRCQHNNRFDLNYDFLKEPNYQEIIRKNSMFVKQYTPVNKRKVSIDEIKTLPYDKFIVGSDQTWSADALYKYSPYYLHSIKDPQKKCSYACSMGKNEVPRNFQLFLKKKLNSFSKLSCREESNSKMLANLLKREVPCVVDPTLLLNHNQWQHYMKPMDMPKEYILCYILGEKKCISDYAIEMGKKKGIPVYFISTRPCDVPKEHLLTKVGVQDFLWLIDNTSLLVTDSFHGTIFAINFGKNMASFDKHQGNMYDNGRIQSVLSTYNIENHYMKDDSKEEPPIIDYKEVHNLLDEKRNYSLNYLKSVIFD